MGRKQSEIGKLFREVFNYYGKLTKECMGTDLWNEYYKMRSKSVNHSKEHLEEVEANRNARKLATEMWWSTKEYQLYKRIQHLMRYCSDIKNIENFEAASKDAFVGWDCHHRLESHFSDGEIRETFITVKELKKRGLYWNRPADELIFLTHSDHIRLHNIGKKYERKCTRN